MHPSPPSCIDAVAAIRFGRGRCSPEKPLLMSRPILSRRRGLAWLAALPILACTPPGWAAAAPGGADPAAVTAPIRALNAELLRIMQAGKTVPFARRYAMLAPTVAAAFDLPLILRVSVGPGWAKLPADQQTALLVAFRRYTVASYVDNFDSFDGEHFDLTPQPRPVPGGAQVVLTQIVSRSGTSHQIDYVMRQVDGAWKAVDVLADGSISRVAVQRSDFRHLLDQGGAPALMASLRRKVRDLSRG